MISSIFVISRISLKAAQAVSDRFLYSSLKNNKNFFGFIALNRCGDRKAINLIGRRTESAIKIQSIFRTYRWRHLASHVKFLSKSNRSAIKIQSICRLYLSHVLVQRMKRNLLHRNAMALRLQSFMRVTTAKSIREKLEQNMWRQLTPALAVKIQKVYRGWVGKKLSMNLRTDREHLYKLRNACILKVQCIIRRYLARKKMIMRHMREIALKQQKFEASIRIQCWFRCRIAYGIMSMKKIQQNKIMKLQRRAAERLKKNMRIFQFKSQVKKAVLRKRWLHCEATKIECWYRSILALKKMKQRRSQKAVIHQSTCAIRIQCMVRKSLAITQLYTLRKNDIDFKRRKEESALILTLFFRKIVAVTESNRRRAARRTLMEKIIALEISSATKIAAAYRGYTGRLIKQRLQGEKKSKWKEMWSHDDGCPFYYNQVRERNLVFLLPSFVP